MRAMALTTRGNRLAPVDRPMPEPGGQAGVRHHRLRAVNASPRAASAASAASRVACGEPALDGRFAPTAIRCVPGRLGDNEWAFPWVRRRPI